MEDREYGQSLINEDSYEVLRKNPGSSQKVIHSLLHGKHIDSYMAEEFRFLENYPTAWEEFFQWMGYRLKKSELGGSPFFFLEPVSEAASQLRLSRGATFLGLYTAWHFFMKGPGELGSITPEEIFKQIVSSYPFHLLRAIFVRRSGNLQQVELSEDQAEKLRGYIKRDLAELAKYRFIDVKPNSRAGWEDLVVHRLPALHRFWELALHVHAGSGNGHDPDIDQVVTQVWGNVEPEPEPEEEDQ